MKRSVMHKKQRGMQRKVDRMVSMRGTGSTTLTATKKSAT